MSKSIYQVWSNYDMFVYKLHVPAYPFISLDKAKEKKDYEKTLEKISKHSREKALETLHTYLIKFIVSRNL